MKILYTISLIAGIVSITIGIILKVLGIFLGIFDIFGLQALDFYGFTQVCLLFTIVFILLAFLPAKSKSD